MFLNWFYFFGWTDWYILTTIKKSSNIWGAEFQATPQSAQGLFLAVFREQYAVLRIELWLAPCKTKHVTYYIISLALQAMSDKQYTETEEFS